MTHVRESIPLDLDPAFRELRLDAVRADQMRGADRDQLDAGTLQHRGDFFAPGDVSPYDEFLINGRRFFFYVVHRKPRDGVDIAIDPRLREFIHELYSLFQVIEHAGEKSDLFRLREAGHDLKLFLGGLKPTDLVALGFRLCAEHSLDY